MPHQAAWNIDSVKKTSTDQSDQDDFPGGADVLHHTVLYGIQRSADHSTVMHSHIANTGGWSKANDAQKYKRKHLMVRQKEIKRQVNALVNAVAAGVSNLQSRNA